MPKRSIIISLGGSIIVPDQIDVNFLRKFKKLINSVLPRYQKIVIVTGGGKVCRRYNEAAMKLVRPKQIDLDWMGIAVTKVNAELVRIIFGAKAYEKVIHNPTLKIKTNKKIIVGSGWKPGCSSDMDAVLLAKNLKAKTVINLSNISYVFDKDPNKFKDAKPIKEMTWQDLTRIVGGKWTPGLNAPFDPIAAKLCMKLGLEVVIMKGTDLANLKNFLMGKKFKGTVIR